MRQLFVPGGLPYRKDGGARLSYLLGVKKALGVQPQNVPQQELSRYLLGYCAEKIQCQLMCCLRFGTSKGRKKIHATPTKPDFGAWFSIVTESWSES